MQREMDHIIEKYENCRIEVEHLQRNLEKFIIKNQKVLNEIKEELSQHKSNTSLARLCYDNCLTTLCHASDMARKFNMILEFQNTEEVQSVPRVTTCRNIERDKPLLDKGEGCKELHLRQVDLTKYVKNSVLRATITYINNYDEHTFYAWDHNSYSLQSITELRSALHLQQFNRLPEENEIFGLVLDNAILRAIIVPSLKTTVRLIDFGEDVPFEATSSICYQLPTELQQIPAQALLCQLTGNIKNLKDCLEKLVYETATFFVVESSADILKVKLVQTCTPDMSLKEQPAQVDNAVSKLSAKELEQLYEEPLCTTNAVKAVLGFVPTDDRRLCRHYDPETGGCFKGGRCKLEHAAYSKDAFTTDVVPAAAFNSREACIRYDDDQIINITVTFLGHLDRFYGQVNNKRTLQETFIWSDDQVPNTKRLKQMPLVYDLVLARYSDGNWYRAQVSEVDEAGKYVKIFFVDYGNSFYAPLSELAHCWSDIARQPFRAELFRIADIRDCSQSNALRTKAISSLRALLENQTFNVRVVSHYEDFFVCFIDEKFNKEIQELLINGLIEPCKTIVI